LPDSRLALKTATPQPRSGRYWRCGGKARRSPSRAHKADPRLARVFDLTTPFGGTDRGTVGARSRSTPQSRQSANITIAFAVAETGRVVVESSASQEHDFLADDVAFLAVEG